MKYVAPSGPLSIGGVLDNWLQLFRASFSSCWALALLAAIAAALLQFAIAPKLPPPSGTTFQAYLHYWAAVSGPSSALANLALAFIGFVIYAALLAQQTAIVRGGETFSVGDALIKGLRRIPQLLLGTLIIMLIIVAIVLPFGIVAAILVATLRRSPLLVLISVPLVIATFIAVIYVTVRLQLWMAVLFSENLGGAASLSRSWELVKGQWWRVTGVGFVSGIVIWILGIAVGAIIGFTLGLIGIHGATPEAALRRVQLIGAAAQVSRLLSMPLLTAVWLAMYQDVRLRREGGDLAARAEALIGS